MTSINALPKCPECGMKWKYKVKEKTYSKIVGIVRQDRVSEWHCPLCSARWDRWTNKLISKGRYPRPSGKGTSRPRKAASKSS